MIEHVIKTALESDIPALKALWLEVFGDGEDFTGEFFRRLWTPGCCRAAFYGGRLDAMGFCLTGPRAMGLSCGYIYAMATRPEARGRGLAAALGRALIDGAFEGGVDIISTLPAEESLCAWYESRLGMEPCFRKGGEGVIFPQSWLDFSAFCGGHSPDTPQTLLAAARPGVGLGDVRGLGWECTFD